MRCCAALQSRTPLVRGESCTAAHRRSLSSVVCLIALLYGTVLMQDLCCCATSVLLRICETHAKNHRRDAQIAVCLAVVQQRHDRATAVVYKKTEWCRKAGIHTSAILRSSFSAPSCSSAATADIAADR